MADPSLWPSGMELDLYLHYPDLRDGYAFPQTYADTPQEKEGEVGNGVTRPGAEISTPTPTRKGGEKTEQNPVPEEKAERRAGSKHVSFALGPSATTASTSSTLSPCLPNDRKKKQNTMTATSKQKRTKVGRSPQETKQALDLNLYLSSYEMREELSRQMLAAAELQDAGETAFSLDLASLSSFSSISFDRTEEWDRLREEENRRSERRGTGTEQRGVARSML